MSCWLSVSVRDEKSGFLLTVDVQVAILMGDFQDKDRVLYCWPARIGPALTVVQLCSLLLILKGVPGLNDEAREWWWDKISEVLVQIGFRKQRMCLGLFTLHSPAGVLSGVICLHVDDVLGTGDELFESKLKELNKLVGLCSMKKQKFDHCEWQYEKHAMKAYIQNLRKADLTLERTKQLHNHLQNTDHKVNYPNKSVLLFTLHSSAVVFIGVICFHADDMLGTGDDLFESKMKELDNLVGFGSMEQQKFDHYEKQYEKHVNGDITISMKAYIQSLIRLA